VAVVDPDADDGVEVEPGSDTESAVWILAIVVGVGATVIAAYARHVNIERLGVAFLKACVLKRSSQRRWRTLVMVSSIRGSVEVVC